MEYKCNRDIRIMFYTNIILFIAGLVSGSDIAIATSIVIAVILSVGIHILEAIYNSKL